MGYAWSDSKPSCTLLDFRNDEFRNVVETTTSLRGTSLVDMIKDDIEQALQQQVCIPGFEGELESNKILDCSPGMKSLWSQVSEQGNKTT